MIQMFLSCDSLLHQTTNWTALHAIRKLVPPAFQIATNRRMTVKYNPPSSCILEIGVKGIKLSVQEEYFASDGVRRQTRVTHVFIYLFRNHAKPHWFVRNLLAVFMCCLLVANKGCCIQRWLIVESWDYGLWQSKLNHTMQTSKADCRGSRRANLSLVNQNN